MHNTTSESQDLSTKEEENEIENITQEKKDRDRQKALRKRARKLRQKLLISGQEFEELSCQDLPQMTNNKLSKILNQINNILTSVQNIDKSDNKRKEMTNGIDKNDNDKVNGEKKKSKKKKASSEEKQIVEPELIENDENSKSDNNKKSKKKKKSESENDKKIDNDKKCDKDKPKLSKTPSVASSMSDMSKISGKSDKKLTNIDWGYFEKVVNELNRAMDKIDKNSQDNLLHGMKIITQLLGLAADKEENGLQITNKCTTTAVTIVNRIISHSAAAAALALNTNCAIHVARLLAGQMEKDQETDKAEQALTKQCLDCLTIALDSVSCTTKMYEEVQDNNLVKERSLLAAVRRRAHCLISYLSLSGCLSQNDYPDPVRESVHAMLSVCAVLCQPCDVDTGQDRTTAVANLRANISPSLCGARSELTSLYENRDDAVRVARVSRLLRSLGELDHGLVQDAFGEGSYPLEFKAAVGRLLAEHAPSDREPDTKNSGGTAASQSEAIALDLIVVIGMMVVNNTQHQETICDNWSAIRTLCNLPANWIVSTHSHVLLPTLAALAQHPPASAIIAGELSKEMIEEYIDSPEAQSVKLVQLINEGRQKNRKN